MTEPTHWSIREALNALKTRRISCSELVEASLRAAAVAQERLNCFIQIDEASAQRRARELDANVHSAELSLGGVPLAHKDMYYRSGQVSSCGSDSRLGVNSTSTARVLEYLDAAGAVQIGTLNMAEFAFGTTGHNHHFGSCHNAWNPAHIPGGSSSGSGAAVASGAVFAALGSDTGGSIRIPAALNGLFGLKPTQGLIDSHGMMPMSPSMDCAGPLARTAEDVGILMDCLAPHALPPGSSFLDQMGRVGKGTRIGVPENYYYDDVHPGIRSLLEASLQRYRDQGCEIVSVQVPDHDYLTSLSYILMSAESSALHADKLRHHAVLYGPQTRARLLAGYFLPAPAYIQARQLRAPLLKRFMEEVFSKCDVMHTPVLRHPAPTLEATHLANDERMVRMITEISYCTRLTNYLGLPALSVPCGFDENHVPVGFQLVGKPYSEQTLIAMADLHGQISGLTGLVAGAYRP